MIPPSSAGGSRNSSRTGRAAISKPTKWTRTSSVPSSPPVYVWNTNGIVDYHAEVDRLRRVAHVVGAAPAILGQGLISASRETAPIQLKGIDPALEPQVTNLDRAMESGSLAALQTAA